MAIRTYTVGDHSGVKRLDELTGSWQSVPLNLTNNQGQDIDIILYDVMTDPLDANKVFVCGQRDAANDNPGIFWSNNAGVSWNKCIGDVANNAPNAGNAILELWVVDSLTIYATSHYGYCYKSVDGGITFNHTLANPFVPGFPAPQDETFSRAIHFADPDNGCVAVDLAGSSNIHVQVTTNGGASWTPTDISTPYPNIGFVGGIHMSNDFQTITLLCEFAILRSTDGGTTFTPVYSVLPIEIGKGVKLLHLSWTSDADLWAYGSNSYRLQSTDNGLTWPIINPWTGSLLCRAGHHYDNAPPHDGFFSENDDILSTSDSSQTGTLSEANQFGGGVQAVWTGISDAPQPPVGGCTDPTATNYDPLATADCLGVVGGTDYSCCIYVAPDDPCECPPGYTFNSDTNECILIETTPANCLPTTILVNQGNQNGQYGQNGTNFYPDVTTVPYPLSDIVVAGPNVNNLQDANLNPILAIQNITNSPLWGGNGPGSGRLWNAGVWTNLAPISGDAQPVDEWIGFTACVDVPVDGVYSLGFAGDNRIRLTIDGMPLVEVGANGGSYSFWYWSVVELTLTAGQHVITAEGYNIGGPSFSAGDAAFAAEIYSANIATLIPMTTPAQLAAVTIWSTADFIPGLGSVPTIPFDLGEASGCSCPDGWVLSNCDGSLECIRTTIIPPTPCNCYLATNCEDPADTELITIDPLLPPLDLNVTYVFNEFPDKCWTIEVSTDCGANPIDAVLVNTGFIDAADNLGVEDQADFNWTVIQGDAPVIPTPAIITNQSFPGYGSLFNALWINQIVSPHFIGITQPSIYETTFLLPTGFNPSFAFDILSDVRAVITLNGFVIGDNSNPVTYPNPLGTPASFSTANPIHFNTGTTPNILTVTISSTAQETDGFVLTGAITSMGSSSVSTEVTVQEIFVDCEDCLGVCYELIDCEGLLDPIQTDTDLSAYVGMVINIVTCPETCWTVNQLPACPLLVEDVTVVADFIDCITCLPSDPPLPPLNIRNRTVKPGYDTVGCSPEYVERISCDWSESVFQQAMTVRYGIEFCCGKDLKDLTIKKELLDFKMITDPNACKATPNDCCPPCNVTAELISFTSVTCPAPTSVVPTLITPNPPIQPNCVEVRLSIKELLDPAIPHNVTGTDCCGIPFDIDIFAPSQGAIPKSVVLCVDLNQPYTVDPIINITPAGNCDCDPIPPFECFCIVPVSNDGLNGFFAGNYCDGTPFDLSIVGGVSYEPICVRADGLQTKSSNIDLTNLGDCTDDGVCDPVPVCLEVTFTNNTTDVTENVNFTLCIALDRTISVGPGVTSNAVCIVAGTAAFGPNITMNILAPCS